MILDLSADSALFVADFGEVIDFRTAPSATTRAGILADVNREPVDTEGGDDKASPFAGRRSPVINVLVRNHATLGIVPTEVAIDTSELKIAYPLGAATEAAGLRYRRIVRIVRHNAGLLLLEVQT